MALIAAVALLVAGIALAVYIDHAYERQRIGDLIAQAHILAATETAALAFSDRHAAEEYLDALGANPQIRAAGLYSKAGALFASFPHLPPTSLPRTYPVSHPALQRGHTTRDGSLLDITAPVRQGDVPLGYLILQVPTEPLAARVQRDGAILLLVAMAALMVGALSVAQAALYRANTALAARAQELAAANRSLEEQIAQREEMEAILRQTQKMEAIGQLTGGIAHDFNNLLQVVLGSLERLRVRAARAGDGLSPDLDRWVDAAMQGGRRAATLTQQLLAFSRRQPLAPKPISVNKLVAGMSDLLARTLGESIRIETVLAGGLWRVLADENQLENTLLNLAVNARDAMDGHGSLTIETANAFLDEAYTRGEQDVNTGQYVVIAVTDTGSGMPPEVLAKVFEPFFTTKEMGRGTGLGLSQVYGFVKQSGGHIKLYSEPGEGTTVKIYLPRLLATVADGGGTLDRSDVPQGREGECILVVEDEDNVRALTVEILRDLGYGVLQAADGHAALALLETEPGVQLLFTDVGLPGGMNGRQLVDIAMRSRPHLKVLFTTGYARNAIIHHGRLDPGVELISKPFSAKDLGHRIRTLLDESAASGKQP
ncbi:MAG: response regulator [Proteobacteria bacterium]|nr:response regulator [Pseudomonadota bacterium]